MSESTLRRVDDKRRLQIADLLRLEWRMFERVLLSERPDGDGFEVTIFLDQGVLRGAAEQQGLKTSAANLAKAEARRAKAISECVNRFNATLPSAERIRDYQVIA